jgi:hypothetical protein
MSSSTAIRALAVAGVAVAMSMAAQVARADLLVPVAPLGTLSLSSDWAATALGQTPSTVTGSGVNNGTPPVLVNDLAANGASTYFFNNSFTSPAGSFADVQIDDASQGPESIGFIDSYVFAVPNATVNSFVFSLNLSSALGLDDLTARLYQYNPGNNQNLTIGGAGTVTTDLIDNWSMSNNPVGGSSLASTGLPVSGLRAGEYVLEIAGLETGSTSGSYSGQLNVSPVPLPGTLLLLLGGLAVLLRYSRHSSAA